MRWNCSYCLMNLMAAEKKISFTGTASVLGCCLLPMALLSIMTAVLSFEGLIGYSVSGLAILWCSSASSPKQEPSWTVVPTPGYGVKFTEVVLDGLDGAEKRKCFRTICHSSELPPPMDDIDEDELAQRIDAGDYSFNVPIGIGELGCVKGKHDDTSVKIDILVNSVFYDKRLSTASGLFYRHFLCMVVCESIEKKKNLELSPVKSIALVNRKRMSDIHPMLINKRPPAPVILEVEKEEKHVDQHVLAEQTPLTCVQQVDSKDNVWRYFSISPTSNHLSIALNDFG